MCDSGAGVSKSTRRPDDETWLAAHLRRSDDWLPRRSRRRPGDVRHHSGPLHFRQGYRRRSTHRGLRWAERNHAKSRPCRQCVSSRNIVRQPARGQRRTRYAASHPRSPGSLRESGSESCRPLRGASAGTHHQSGRFHVYAFLHPNACHRLRNGENVGHRPFGKFFHHLLENGVYFPPSQFEAAFLSAAHTDADIEHARKAISSFF